MIICSVCGSENMDGSVYCEDCGARLPAAAPASGAQTAPQPAAPPPAPAPAPAPIPAPEPVPQAAAPPAPGGVITCAACGAENPPDESYCEDCGASLSAGAPSVSLTPEPPPQVLDQTPALDQGPVVRARLVLVDNNQEFILDKDVVNIGRRSPVDGIFPEVDLTDADKDSYISRRHGKLTLGDTQAVYEDLGSSNGSFLNGARLQSGVQTVVKDGDRLRLGKTEMVFRGS